MTMTEASWISAHIYYHSSLDELIDGAARPLVATLRSRARITQHFFVRYWQGGPHLRLRLLPAAVDDHDAVAAALDDATAAFLRARPSRTVIDGDDYRRMTGPLASAEPGASAIEPLEPDNTLRWRAYQPEL